MVVDLLTILPVVLTIAGDPEAIGIDRKTVGFVSVLRVMKVLRLLRLQRVMAYFDDEIYTQMFKMVLTVTFIIFFASGVMESIENSVEIIAPSGEVVEALTGSKTDVATGILRVIRHRLVCRGD